MKTHQMNESERKSNSLSPVFLLCLLTGGILLCSLSFLLDHAVSRWVNGHDISLLHQSARFLSAYGDWPQLMVLGVIGLGIALLVHNRALTRLLICMMISSSIAGALVNTVRLTSGRARPNYAEATREWNGLWHDGQFLLLNNKYHAFPSGHSAAASAFFGVPLFARRKYGRWSFLIALAIGWARIYLNVHHLSDVSVGIFVGTLTAYFVWVRIRPIIDERLTFEDQW
jgi:membrane-associated phospholipid phosphatase